MFSAEFFSLLVYGSLGWCALSAIALLVMLVRDLARGATW